MSYKQKIFTSEVDLYNNKNNLMKGADISSTFQSKEDERESLFPGCDLTTSNISENSAYWVRFTIKNNSSENKILNFKYVSQYGVGDARTELADFYLIANKTIAAKKQENFEVIFKPRFVGQSPAFIFELEGLELEEGNGNVYLDTSSCSCYTLINILENEKDNSLCNKFAVQGAVQQKIFVNIDEIHVGLSRFYETPDEVKVSYLAFAPKYVNPTSTEIYPIVVDYEIEEGTI